MNEWQRSSANITKQSLGSASLALWSLQDILDLASSEEKQQWHDQRMQYASIQGEVELRDLISQNYSSVSAENIVVFSGAQEALSCLYLAILDGDSKVLGLTPSYTPMNLSVTKTGAEFTEFPLTTENNKWSLNFYELNKKVNEQLDLLIANFPHNPTGFLPKLENWQSTLNKTETAGSWVICDEVFKGLEYDKNKALLPVCDLLTRGISVGSLSKAYGCPSARIGWIATHDKGLIDKVLTIKRYFSICTSNLDAKLAKIMIKNKKLVLSKNTDLLKSRYNLLLDQYESKLSNWIEISPVEAGMVLFPRLKNNLDSHEFCQKFLSASGYRFEPGRCFADGFDAHFRLGLGASHLEQGLIELHSFLINSYS